jgi:Protein of unknown function (DUF3105)
MEVGMKYVSRVIGLLSGWWLLGLGNAAECISREMQDTVLVANHFQNCSELEMKHYPPMGGSHYGVWAAFKEYDQPIAPGFWLHNLEHGGLVILYHCPNGCPQELSLLRSLIARLPEEIPLCPGTERRAILAPDSKMEPGFAVLAWEHAYLSNCVDSAAFQTFMLDHFRRAPEDICSSGRDVLAENLCPQSALENGRLGMESKPPPRWRATQLKLGRWRLNGSEWIRQKPTE